VNFDVVGVDAELVADIAELGECGLGAGGDPHELDGVLAGRVIRIAVGSHSAGQHFEALLERDGVGNSGGHYLTVEHEAPFS
jgi:hypothetical protein